MIATTGPAAADNELIPAEMPAELADKLATRFHPPEGWRWGHFTAPAGHRLRFGQANPTDGAPRGTVVLLPGFSEFGEKYFETAGDLLDAGFQVWTLDWRGQGGSQRYYPDRPQRPGAQGHDRDAADLIAFSKQVLAETPRPRVLVAHSMGGLNTLLAVAQAPEIADRVVLSAPMLALADQGYPEWALTALASTMTALGQGHRYTPGSGDWTPERLEGAPEGRRTTGDPTRGAIHDLWMQARPELRLGGASFAWLDAALAGTHSLQNRSDLAEIQVPILMGTAGADDFVDSQHLAQLCARLGDCRRRHFPDAFHELFMERDSIRQPWLEAVTAFAQGETLPAANQPD